MNRARKYMVGLILSSLVLLVFMGCRGQQIPQGAKAVTPFELDKYLGTWYEIARFDFKFEKDLNNVTAQYSKNDDGTVRVVNRGYNYLKDEWKEAIGKAKFREATDVAALKVSFFGPFYAGYNVLALDKDYTYALVAGKNLDYMWILSREKTIPEAVKAEYLSLATSLGYDISKLIWVEHDK